MPPTDGNWGQLCSPLQTSYKYLEYPLSPPGFQRKNSGSFCCNVEQSTERGNFYMQKEFRQQKNLTTLGFSLCQEK